MAKRIHFCENDVVLCNQLGPKAQRYKYKTPAASYAEKHCRKLKTTEDPAQVTCIHCKEKLSEKSRTFLCPVCAKPTDTFLLTETVTIHSSVTAKQRGRRTQTRTEQRTLINITCPICKAVIPVNESWNKISCDMKVEGLLTETFAAGSVSASQKV